MMKSGFILIIIALLLMHTGCLVRYGEDRLCRMIGPVKELETQCMRNNEKLTGDKIKEKLGKPGLFKPVYENNLDLNLLNKLDNDEGVLLKPNREKLYKIILNDIENEGLKSVRLLSYVYDRMGRDDCSLTFYIGNYTDPDGGQYQSIIGWDYVEYAKYIASGNKERKFINYKIDKPSDYLRLPFTFLVDTIIGLKQFAGEVVKSPFSFVEAEIFKNIFVEKKVPFYKLEGLKAFFEDWRNGATALTYRYRVDGKQGFFRTAQNLLGEVPVVGPVFDQWYKKDIGAAKKLFLTRGIYGGNGSIRNMALWSNFFTSPFKHLDCEGKSLETGGGQVDNEITNGLSVKVIPYQYGSIVDVFWSLLNISHGFAYDMASEIVLKNDVGPGESISLAGHSGGVQRILSTSRILYDDGVMVDKIYGVAGPALGYAPCNEIEVVLNGKIMQDAISAATRLLNLLTLRLLSNVKWEKHNDNECKNSEYEDKCYLHMTPGFVDGKTRLKYDGFMDKHLYDFFRTAKDPPNNKSGRH